MDTKPGDEARNELDTRADTICAGANFRCIRLTGMVCQVKGFHESFEAIPNIPVATVVTKWKDQTTGISYILVIHQALYFGAQMDHSLINVNQIRVTGIPVCDDPYDRYRTIGIDMEEVFIPFHTEGNTLYFSSCVPSDEDLENCPYLVLTDDIEWDPGTVDLTDPRPKEICATSVTNKTSHQDWAISTATTRMASSIISNMRISTISETTVTTREVASKTRHSVITPEHLARTWNIGLDKAKETLRVTTQKGIRFAIHPIHRRYRVDHLAHLGLNVRRLSTLVYVDHLQSKVKSLSQNTGAFVFTTGAFTKVYTVKSTAEAGEALSDFVRDVGVPTDIRTDLASYFTGHNTTFVKETKRLHIKVTYAEKGRHNQNHAAEREIRNLKRRWHNKMTAKAIPKRLWDFGLVHQAELISRIARGKNGRTGYEEVVGETPDISEWIDFDMYDLIWYHDPPDLMAETTKPIKQLGRWIGVSHRVGSALSYWVLTQACKVLVRSTIQHVTVEERLNPATLEQINEFDKAVKVRLDDTGFFIENVLTGENVLQDEGELEEEREAYGDGTNTPTEEEYRLSQKPPERLEEDDIETEAYDKLIGAELMVDFGTDGKKRATVKKRARDYDGNLLGSQHRNPQLDQREYEIEYDDGTSQRMFGNIIAANLYAQMDEDGTSHTLLNEIVDHRKDETAVNKENGFILSRYGRRTPKRTTKGWELCVEWRNGDTSWIPLKDLKDTNPVELAEYAVANKINDEPAFAWWVPKVIKHRERIIAKLKKKYWRTEYKFGIRLPKTVEEALEIDRQTGTEHWARALRKEMVKVAVAIKPKEGVVPNDVRTGKVSDMIGFQEIKCHVIFDVKMDFTRKVRFVAGGHLTQADGSLTYSSVVSRDSVRISLVLAAANGLEILSCDVGNAYLNAPCREKIWFQAGKECGADAGKVMVVTRALYGLRTSGASWRQMLADTLTSPEFGFKPSRGDPDVYLRKRTRPNDQDYYEMVLVFVDDILCVSHAPRDFMEQFAKVYDLRGSVEEPKIYLGSNISKQQLPDGNIAWTMSSDTYVKNMIHTVKEMLREKGKELRTTQRRGRTPLPVNYKPELDVTRELDTSEISEYLQLIGMLRWAVELGRIDIALETALMSQYSASPREGHMEAVFYIFAYLTLVPSGKIVFDPTTPYIDESCFQHDVDWKPFYGDIHEELPLDMPEPLGMPMDVYCFVDANHAGNTVTRRSQTGILIFVQNAPIIWHSKKQNTVEASTFGSELVAMRVARDLIVALRIKLRYFGVPLGGPAFLLCDNQGVVKNTSIPESTLTKKHNAINYHIIRESAAMGILKVGKEDTETNLADLLTKILNQPRREKLLGFFMYLDDRKIHIEDHEE